MISTKHRRMWFHAMYINRSPGHKHLWVNWTTKIQRHNFQLQPRVLLFRTIEGPIFCDIFSWFNFSCFFISFNTYYQHVQNCWIEVWSATCTKKVVFSILSTLRLSDNNWIVNTTYMLIKRDKYVLGLYKYLKFCF
jgi:hypothetical protein